MGCLEQLQLTLDEKCQLGPAKSAHLGLGVDVSGKPINRPAHFGQRLQVGPRLFNADRQKQAKMPPPANTLRIPPLRGRGSTEADRTRALGSMRWERGGSGLGARRELHSCKEHQQIATNEHLDDGMRRSRHEGQPVECLVGVGPQEKRELGLIPDLSAEAIKNGLRG
jgi:hypothetical protein